MQQCSVLPLTSGSCIRLDWHVFSPLTGIDLESDPPRPEASSSRSRLGQVSSTAHQGTSSQPSPAAASGPAGNQSPSSSSPRGGSNETPKRRDGSLGQVLSKVFETRGKRSLQVCYPPFLVLSAYLRGGNHEHSI